MKGASLLSLLLLLMNNLQSQVISSSDSMPVAGKLKYSLFEKGVIINKTDKGIIYALPQDHMPVLRPDTTLVYTMPNHKTESLPFRLFHSNPQIKPKEEKNLWRDSLILTPGGAKTIYKPLKPMKLILPNRQ